MNMTGRKLCVMENTIERCMIISEKDNLDVDDLPQHIRAADTSVSKISESVTMYFTDDNIVPFEKIKEKSIRHCFESLPEVILLKLQENFSLAELLFIV